MHKRAACGKIHKVQLDGSGPNGKGEWGIPLAELTPRARARWATEQSTSPDGDGATACQGRSREFAPGARDVLPPDAAGGSAPSPSIRTCKGHGAVGRKESHQDNGNLAPTASDHAATDRGVADDGERGQSGRGQAPPAGPCEAEIASPMAGQQTPARSTATVAWDAHDIPVLADNPRRVFEAGLVASRSPKAVEQFRHHRRAVLALEAAQATCEHGEALNIARRVARELGMTSHRTLLVWQRAWRAEGEPALVPKWKKKDGSRTIPKRLQAQLEAFYAQPNRPTLAQCYRYARDWCVERYDRTGRVLDIPSYHAVRRHIDAVTAKRPMLVEAGRHGKKRFADKYEFCVNRDERAMPLNECWVLDHRVMDTHIILPNGNIGRPWLTCVADIHSADFVGWVLRVKDEVTSDAVACAMRNGILGFSIYDELLGQWHEFPAHGCPDFAYIDRGKEFTAKNRGGRGKGGQPHSPKGIVLDPEHENTLFGTLGIKPVRAIPYSARSKPIEPWFGSFAKRIENQIAGWCGHNTLSKPADLDARRKKGELLSWTQYLGVLARAIQQWRHEQPIGHRDLPPALYWDDYQPTLPNPADLDLLLLRKKDKKVRNQGITIQHGKLRPWHYLSDDPQFALLGAVELDIRWSPDHPESCIAIHPATAQRWELHRVDLRHDSWNMMLGDEPGDKQLEVLRARRNQRSGVTAYRRWAADQLDPDLADPTGTLRVAADNGQQIRGIKRDVEAERDAARRERTAPAEHRPPSTAPAQPTADPFGDLLLARGRRTEQQKLDDLAAWAATKAKETANATETAD